VATGDHPVFLGDYVDVGVIAVENTVNFLIGALSTIHRLLFLGGMHDELCSDWFK